jgi:alkylation response protein AidB-like acyl-CoA dehydrogenase
MGEEMPEEPRPGRSAARTPLLAAIAAMRDALASQCEAEEAQATLSAASVDALVASGVLHMKLPAALGGAEADPVTQLEVIEAVSAINASAGWCTMVGATSLGLPGAFLPEAGVARMFEGGRIPRGAIVVMPAGTAQPVAGGYRLNGRWSFASGVRHAEWITAGCRVERTAGAAPEVRFMVFPAAAARIHDNWRVAGLRGTGSCDISVADLFVPDAMTWNLRSDSPHRGGPLYRLGLPAFVANEHAAFALGSGRRALDALVEVARAKKRGIGPGGSLAERGAVQRVIGQSEMRLRAARALAIELNDEAWDRVCAGQTIPPRLHTELRSNATYCTEVAADIATQAFRYAGGSAIYQEHVLQRCLRDINVAAQHLMVSDVSYENLGKCALGFEGVEPMG